MTNKEWIDLIAKEFSVSNNIAKEMLHAMYEARKRKLDFRRTDYNENYFNWTNEVLNG